MATGSVVLHFDVLEKDLAQRIGVHRRRTMDAIPMTFLSTLIVTTLFGEAYQASGGVLAIHIWASVFVFLGVASSKWFIAENRQLMSFQRTALGAVANIMLNLWLIPIYGVVGAAIATVFSQAAAAWFFDVFQTATRKIFLMKTKAMNPLRLNRFAS